MGDAEAGEWLADGRRGVLHLRRRLTGDEADAFTGPVVDIRNTAEAEERADRVRPYVGFTEIL